MFKHYKFVKDIQGYEELYKITAKGGVWSVRHKRFLTPIRDKDGYLTIGLYRDGFMKSYRIHRLVAQAFIPNPNNLATVNHKNHQRTDNRVSNLEWMSFADNIKDAKSIKVCMLDDAGEIKCVYSSIKEASIHTGIYYTGISKAVRGIQKDVKDTRFRKYNGEPLILRAYIPAEEE